MIKITKAAVAEIERQARETAPRECCGFLAGKSEIIERAYLLQNVAPHPSTRYFADPKDIIEAQKLMRARGETLQGVYHSHPRSPAYPSETDVQQAYYPEAVYFIISLEATTELRCFLIRDGKAQEIEYQVVADSTAH
jgi:proteasome lid subunit RPN8/RPN11